MKAKQVVSILGISKPTLSKYVKEWLIRIDNKSNGRYFYNDESVYSLIGCRKCCKNKYNVIYARVSNPPKKYLDEQIQRISNFCISKGIQVNKVYSDIKSGMNFNRDGLDELILDIVKGNIDTIIIENKDRLCRFGFEFFSSFCKFYKTKILIISDLSEKSYEQELTEDLLSIIHYFSMKSYSHRRKLNKLRKELENNDNN